jgi:hypothetical protein
MIKYFEENEGIPKSKKQSSIPNYYLKLYDDANKQQNKKVELTSNVYVEEGITFNPKINDNKNFNIQSNFNERNQKLIELKQQILSKMNEPLNKRTMSREKIIENNQRVVQRLYNNEMEKLKRIRNKNKNELQAVVTYKENLKKTHKISFKKNYFLTENTKNLSNDLVQAEESLSNNIEAFIKDNGKHLIQLSEIPVELDNSSKKDIIITKRNSIVNSKLDHTNDENLDDEILSRHSNTINDYKESIIQENNKPIESPNIIRGETESQIKENEEVCKSTVEVKSKTLQNLLNKNKK